MIGLSRHIEILLLSNDCVIVPGFGGFMAHHIDARKDKSDGSFLPPIRSIGFNPKLILNDSLLAQSYVEAYDISYPDATMRIEDEVRELRQRIEADGHYTFKGIGTISLNGDGNYEFEPCEAGILSPELYGLGSFEMSTVSELRKTSAVDDSDMQEGMDKGAQIVSIDNSDSRVTEAAEDSSLSVKAVRTVAMWRNIAVAAVAAIIFLLIPSPLVNNGQIAGNHIDTRLLDRIMPKDITTGQDKVNSALVNSLRHSTSGQSSDRQVVKSEEKTASTGKYGIVVASHVTLKNANAYVRDLQSRGYEDAYVYGNGHVKVLIGRFATRQAASDELNRLSDKTEFSGAWITETKE